MQQFVAVMRSFRRGVAVMMLGVMAVVITACSSNGEFPPIANPPPFDYADGEELRSGMHQLAYELLQLDLLMISDDNRDARFQRDVVGVLENIERIGGRIRETDLSSRHRFLLEDMTQFLATVSRAKRSAQSNPARFYQTGQVSGACMSCHRSVR